MIVLLELKARNITARICYKLAKISFSLKAIHLSNRLNTIAKLVDIEIYQNMEFLSYVKEKSLGLQAAEKNIKTLIVRGSIADYSIHPKYLKNSYNLGLTSSDLYTSYYLYHNLKTQLKHLDRIILFAGVFTQGYALSQTKERFRMVAYNHFFKIPIPSELKIKKRYISSNKTKCKRLKVNIPTDFRGYHKKHFFISNYEIEDRVKKHLRENEREPNQLMWLKKLHDEISKDRKELIIVLPPYRSDYLTLLPETKILYSKLLSLNLIEAKFINYNDCNLFDDSDFGDSYHLNEKGAIKLTKDLSNRTNP